MYLIPTARPLDDFRAAYQTDIKAAEEFAE